MVCAMLTKTVMKSSARVISHTIEGSPMVAIQGACITV